MLPAMLQRVGHLTQEVGAERGVIVDECHVRAGYRVKRAVAVRAKAAAGSFQEDDARKVSGHHFTRERIGAVVRYYDLVRPIRGAFDGTQRPGEVPRTITRTDTYREARRTGRTGLVNSGDHVFSPAFS